MAVGSFITLIMLRIGHTHLAHGYLKAAYPSPVVRSAGASDSQT